MKIATTLIHIGRDTGRFEGLVNPPICRASTILQPDLASFNAAASNKQQNLYYGRFGTQTSKLLEKACCELDEGHGAVLFPSGLAAIAHVLRTWAEPGSHYLVVDSVYGPVRDFCENELRRLGVDVTWYAPTSGRGIKSLMRPETRLVYCESPGSLTFELQDLREISKVSAEHGAITVADNTWATPYFFKPLDSGIDISIQSASKYLAGHSDVMMGIAVSNERCWPMLKRSSALYGNAVSPDDCYTVLRGLRTLGVRLDRHYSNALQIATWLSEREEVSSVLYPALETHPDHALWQRDFQGASGLLGVEFVPSVSPKAVDELVDRLHLFGIGVSWGGFESLALPSHPRRSSFAAPRGSLLRLHIGLEDVNDLLDDLESSLDQCIRSAVASRDIFSDNTT